MSTSTKWARFSYPGTPTSFWATMAVVSPVYLSLVGNPEPGDLELKFKLTKLRAVVQLV